MKPPLTARPPDVAQSTGSSAGFGSEDEQVGPVSMSVLWWAARYECDLERLTDIEQMDALLRGRLVRGVLISEREW